MAVIFIAVLRTHTGPPDARCFALPRYLGPCRMRIPLAPARGMAIKSANDLHRLKHFLGILLLASAASLCGVQAKAFSWDTAVRGTTPRDFDLGQTSSPQPSLARAQAWLGLRPSSSRHGLSVFWWNIHNGKINGSDRDANSSLNENLMGILNLPGRPDILAFAEFRQNSVSSEVLRVLTNQFPYRLLNAYPSTPGYGVAIFSRYPFEIIRTETLDFTPVTPSLSENDRAAYRRQWCPVGNNCRRQVSLLSVKTPRGAFYFSAVHLSDAWRILEGRVGRMSTAREIAFGVDNPVYHQMRRLRDFLTSALPQGISTANFLLVGDFNLPSRILAITPTAFRELSSGLNVALRTQGRATSFPSLSSNSHERFPEMQIDHAFAARNLTIASGEMLPLRGSDHYPLFFEIENNSD